MSFGSLAIIAAVGWISALGPDFVDSLRNVVVAMDGLDWVRSDAPISLFAIAPFLIAGAVSDWRTRTAPNWLWYPVAGISVAHIVFTNDNSLIAAVVCGGLGYFYFRMGMAGGGDAKAIMAFGGATGSSIDALILIGVAGFGGVAWAITGEKKVPFLIPFAAAVTTWAIAAVLP